MESFKWSVILFGFLFQLIKGSMFLEENYTALSSLFQLNFNSRFDNFNYSSSIFHPAMLPPGGSNHEIYVDGVWRGNWSNQNNESGKNFWEANEFNSCNGKYIMAGGKDKEEDFPQLKLFFYDGNYLSKFALIIINGFNGNLELEVSKYDVTATVLVITNFVKERISVCNATIQFNVFNVVSTNLQMSLISEDCGIDIVSNVMSRGEIGNRKLIDQLEIYGYILSVIVALTIYVGRCEIMRPNATNRQWSLVISLYLLTWNMCVFIGHYFFFMNFCSFFKLLFPIIFLLLYIVVVLSNERLYHRLTEIIMDNFRRSYHCLLCVAILVIFSFGLQCISILALNYDWFLIAFCSLMWFPQIISNAYYNCSPVSLRLILVVTINHTFVPIYFRLFNNFLELRPQKYWIAFPIILALQIVIMLVQKTARFKKLTRRLFHRHQATSYDINILERSAINASGPTNLCPVCLGDLSKNPENEQSQTTETIRTPCNHLFHLYCLNEWIKHRGICPICRSPLPIIEEIADEI